MKKLNPKFKIKSENDRVVTEAELMELWREKHPDGKDWFDFKKEIGAKYTK